MGLINGPSITGIVKDSPLREGLDSISFSNVAVPYSATILKLMVGAGTVLADSSKDINHGAKGIHQFQIVVTIGVRRAVGGNAKICIKTIDLFKFFPVE